MKITITGSDELMAALGKMKSQLPKEMSSTLRLITEDLLGKSIDLAPVDKGDLRKSGFAESDDESGTVGFTEIYALRQHEHIEYAHPKGGQAKYLEQPFNESQPAYVKMIGDKIAGVVE